MPASCYSGVVEYLDEEGRLEFDVFKIYESEIQYEARSITKQDGSWTLQGMAKIDSDNKFRSVKNKFFQSNVKGPNVTLEFSIKLTEGGSKCHVLGTWLDSDGKTRFKGILEQENQ